MRCKVFRDSGDLDMQINTWLSMLNDQEWEISHVVASSGSACVLVFVRRKT